MGKSLAVYYSPDLNLSAYGSLLREGRICLKEIKPSDISDIKSCENLKVFLLGSEFIINSKHSGLLLSKNSSNAIIIINNHHQNISDKIDEEPVFLYLNNPEEKELLKAIKSGFDYLQSKTESERLNLELDCRIKELNDLNEIGIALSAEQDYDKLLELILLKSREITHCDAGSLYLIEKSKEGGKKLIFKLVQNDTIPNVPFKEYVLPLTRASLAGYVTLTGEFINLDDVYHIPAEKDYGFNKAFDEKFNYRTKSMLVVPMKDHRNEIMGVLQLINRKRSRDVKLTSEAIVEEEVISFDEKTFGLVNSLASQAAVSIENNSLYQNIQQLFEGFVKASVFAIEKRDPTTCGHSERVSTLTVGLAELVDRTASGKYEKVHFTRDEIKEIRYAGLLHDFGKVGVRENVLVKAKKLYPHDLRFVLSRFDFIKKTIECEYLEKKIELLRNSSLDDSKETIGDIEKKLKEELLMLDGYIAEIRKANEPSILEEGTFNEIIKIAAGKYLDYEGNERNFLTPQEMNFLRLKKGTLDDHERLEIESHVTHTYEFLMKIPWTKELEQIPNIAYAHHEKLDGSGYPLKINGDKMPIQSRMMVIADIYDALTARDRPYKKAISYDKAIDIIGDEVKCGAIDAELYNLFVKEKVYELVNK